MEIKAEVLAPAGSMESMIAAINAGADAVYMGGSRFGARAYAKNPEDDRFLEAIDYAHLHGARLYMTVNTLLKEQELGELYDFLAPFYERGLDAAIVQDMGVFSFIREQFPDLPIHASTQMTVTGFRGAKQLKELGATRIVTARELSLEEIARIRDEVDIEIESFVHGALCYCYSGQCLLSSLIGGRSGNRGRCAQPCRLPYEAAGGNMPAKQEGKQKKGGKPDQGGRRQERTSYLLSLKDLCTLDLIPDILEAGVYSLKIEGRMKSPRYTAGVVSVYRKYVDLFLKEGRRGYHVDEADRNMLLELFDRGGFTDGYYRQHNGRNMVAIKEKPAFREGNQALFDMLDREYVDKKKQEPVHGIVSACQGEPLCLELESGAHQVRVYGDTVQAAQNQPLTEEKLLRQINRTGNTPFFFETLQAKLQGDCFVPVQALNELRRNGMEALQNQIQSAYCRPHREPAVLQGRNMGKLPKTCPALHVCLEEESMLEAALRPDVACICLDAAGFAPENWKQVTERVHAQGKRCELWMPHIFRAEAQNWFDAHRELLHEAGFDGFLLRSMEELSYLREAGLGGYPMRADFNLYAMNHRAAEQMLSQGFSGLTFPVELNGRELELLACESRELWKPGEGWEMPVYGYLPVMVSAQCIVKTTKGCKRKQELLYLKDRKGKELPVKNRCRFCYNTIYNPSPLSLLGEHGLIERLAPSSIRLTFSMERPEQIGRIIDAFAGEFLRGEKTDAPFSDFTRGHEKRGVE